MMIILNNTKKIQAKLLYDLLKKSFDEFYGNGITKPEIFNYGIGINTISVENTEGTEIYNLTITDEEITINESAASDKKTGEKLRQFVEACLK